MKAALRRIGARYPAVQQTVEAILRLDVEVDRLPTIPFFEPISLVEVVDGKRRLIDISPDLLSAWCQHAAYGSRVRMRSVERGIVSELEAGQLLCAMVLLRGHMEAAAQAAYCEELLVDAASSGKWDGMGEILLRTMLGTSLRIAARRVPEINEFISPAEHFPLEIGETIKALDRFAAAGHSPGRHSQVLYSFLCEFAHPALRGIRASFEATEDEFRGWTIRYRSDSREVISEADIPTALEILVENMRYGYACSELLRRSRVTGVFPALTLEPPSSDDGHFIWSQLLQRPGAG